MSSLVTILASFSEDLFTLGGFITDDNGDPVSGTPVNLIHGGLIVATAITGADGSYFLDGLQGLEEDYSIRLQRRTLIRMLPASLQCMNSVGGPLIS